MYIYIYRNTHSHLPLPDVMMSTAEKKKEIQRRIREYSSFAHFILTTWPLLMTGSLRFSHQSIPEYLSFLVFGPEKDFITGNSVTRRIRGNTHAKKRRTSGSCSREVAFFAQATLRSLFFTPATLRVRIFLLQSEVCVCNLLIAFVAASEREKEEQSNVGDIDDWSLQSR